MSKKRSMEEKMEEKPEIDQSKIPDMLEGAFN
jgi:hypothetical protein